MKRFFCCGVVVVMMLLLLVGCGQKGSANDAGDSHLNSMIDEYFALAEQGGAQSVRQKFPDLIGDEARPYDERVKSYRVDEIVVASQVATPERIAAYGRALEKEFRGMHTPADDYAECIVSAELYNNETEQCKFLFCKYGTEWTLIFVDNATRLTDWEKADIL